MLKWLRGVGLALIAVAALMCGAAKAEVIEISGPVCTSPQGFHGLHKWLKKGLGLVAALVVVNDEAQSCVIAQVRFDTDKFKMSEVVEGSAIVEVGEMQEVYLLEDWRPIPEWFKPFRFMSFDENAKFLSRTPGGATPSRCVDKACI